MELTERRDQLATMDAQALRELAASLLDRVSVLDTDNRTKQLKIDQLTHEMAVLKRWRFGKRSEQLDSEQRLLFEEALDADLEAISQELSALRTSADRDEPKTAPKRAPLPASLPRTVIRHEPASTTCACGCQMKRIGEDVAEKLDYTPGVFTVERHVRGKWACTKCEHLVQAAVPAHVIDKGIPTAGLLANALIAKYQDHLPLYRQEAIYGRAGLPIARSTLAQWVGACGVQLQPLTDALRSAMLEQRVLHADETPVPMLTPGKGKTHKAFMWAYGTTVYSDLKAVVYEFAESRSGANARRFLDGWSGTLICDDYAGYKALFETGVTEGGCMAHARRKFHDLWANHKSPGADEALTLFRELYAVEGDGAAVDKQARERLRRERARPIADTLHEWLILHRHKATDGTALAKAIDYSLKRWDALTRYLDNGDMPIDNNWLENRIRPLAIGRSNWLFAGSLRAGQRAAAVMTLIQSANLNGHDPYAYLKDVLERLPSHPASRIDELLPHRWSPILAG